MWNQFDLINEIPKVLHAIYWIVVDVSNVFEEAKEEANGGLKLHLMLASKRFSIIAEHLKIALEAFGIKADKRLEEDEIRKRIGTLPMMALEDLRKTVRRAIGEFIYNYKNDTSWLSYKLIETADIICIAASFLKVYTEILEKGGNNAYIWRVCLILKAIIHDLEVIENTHRCLALKPEILMKDLQH